MSDACATCGLCCRSYLVPLFGHDLYRLVTRRRLDPREFVFFCEQDQPDRVGFRLERGGPTYGLALTKQGALAADRPCIFLAEADDGTSRCSVYEDRPIACATYPMSRMLDGIAMLPTALCPPGAWPSDETERPTWSDALQRLSRYRDTYVEVVNRWNAWVDTVDIPARPPEHFVAYVLQVYARIAQLDEQLGVDRLEAIERSWATLSRSAPSAGTSSSEPEWIAHLRRTRSVIDEFFPDLPRLPFARVQLRPESDGSSIVADPS